MILTKRATILYSIEMTLLSTKELALTLHRSVRFIWYMRERGFEMVAGRATISDAIAFLKSNPHPCRKANIHELSQREVRQAGKICQTKSNERKTQRSLNV